MAAPSVPENPSLPNTAEIPQKQRLLGHLSMVLFASLIAGSFSIGALAAPHIESAALNSIRFFLATVMIGIACALSLGLPIARPAAPWRFLILGVPMALYFITMFVALKITDPVSTGAVFTLGPFMAAGFGYLILGQRSGPVILISLALSAVGSIWVIFKGDVNALLGFSVGKGEVIFFFGCMGHAFYAPMVKRLNRGEPVIWFTFWTLAATTLLITLYGINDIVETNWRALPTVVWIAIAYLAIFTTAVTFFLIQFASLRLPASKVFSYVYLTPVIVILLEGFAGHGWATFSVAIGAMVIVMGLIILVITPD